MTLSAVLALLASALGAYVGLLAWRFRQAPGLRDQGWFAAAAFSAAAFSSLNVLTTSAAASDALVIWAAKGQFALGLFHTLAWFRYGSAYLGRPWRREGPATWLLLAAALPLLLPGVGFTGAVSFRPVGFGGVVYRDAEPSGLGLAVVALSVALFLATLVRFAAAWRRGVAYAWLHVAALGLVLLMAVNDGLNVAGLLHGVYLLDLGFLVPVMAVTYALSGRVVEESRTLAELWGQLERTVEERTAELARSQEALHRTEKLAALGQFSAGVSHEVSNPASVVAANLRYLEEALLAGPPPPDTRECLVESREAVERIARLTRQLLDASRLAAAPQVPAARVVLAEVVADVVKAAGPRLAGRTVVVEVPPELAALGEPQALAQVLERLLDNALRSLRPGTSGRVSIRGERALTRARLVVEDDGVGMDEQTLARAFDPFFTTRVFGTGTGLGLSVARGLIQSMRGDLRLESAPGRGTRAVVELPVADPTGPAVTPRSGSLPQPA